MKIATVLLTSRKGFEYHTPTRELLPVSRTDSLLTRNLYMADKLGYTVLVSNPDSYILHKSIAAEFSSFCAMGHDDEHLSVGLRAAYMLYNADVVRVIKSYTYIDNDAYVEIDALEDMLESDSHVSIGEYLTDKHDGHITMHGIRGFNPSTSDMVNYRYLPVVYSFHRDIIPDFFFRGVSVEDMAKEVIKASRKLVTYPIDVYSPIETFEDYKEILKGVNYGI